MRTVKASISRRGWRALLVAGAAVLGVTLAAGCGDSGPAQGASGGGGYAAPPATTAGGAAASGAAADSAAADTTTDAGAEAETVSEQTYDVWADDGCLEYVVVDSAGDTIAASATNLCRTQVSTFTDSTLAGAGVFYALFPRGQGLGNWQAVVGQGEDGYDYWEYSDGQLYRQPAGGGDVQLVVQLADGERTFADESAFLQQNPTGISYFQSETEGTAAEAIASEELGGPVQLNPQLSGGASTEYAQAQDGISAAGQQAQESGQAYEQATQGEITADQELVKVAQAQEDFNKIWFSPDCTGSDNVEDGCGGANAFNDDGGVGEGES